MKPLHRIREVMRREEVTDRTLGRHLGVTEKEAREVATQTHDLTVGQLLKIALLLDCPPAELLVDSASDELIKLRAMVLRLARITNTLLQQAPNAAIKSLAQSLKHHILEVMPQAKGVGELMAVGCQRSSEEYGRCVENVIHFDDWRGDPSGEVLSQ